MKRLIIYHPSYGHVDVKEGEVVKTGSYAGLNIDQAFEKIVSEGYGERKLSPMFSVEFSDGTNKILKHDQAGQIRDMENVEEVVVMAPFAGG